MRGLIIFLLLLAALFVLTGRTFLAETLPGQRAETRISPSRRFSAQLWRCCDAYAYISGFEIRDRETGRTAVQNLREVEGISEAGGVYFEWTPNEMYLVLVTDIPVSSHGCDDLLVYRGDGSQLVYSSVDTNICHDFAADMEMAVIALCANDDILYRHGTTAQRLTPATGLTVAAETCV